MDALITRALDALRIASKPSGDHRVVALPATVLDRAGLPPTLALALIHAGRLVSNGVQDQWRIVETIPRTPNVLFAIDVPNLVSACAGAGMALDLLNLHDRARGYGTVVFPLAFLDPRAAPESLQQELARAGFDVVSCRALSTAAGDPKGTVDQKLDAVVRRHLEWSMVDSVIIGSEDQNFLELVHEIRDRGRTCIVSAVNTACSLARAANDAFACTPAGADIAPERPWNPEAIIDDLERMASVGAAEQPSLHRQIELRAPLVARVLRTMYLRRERMPTRMPAFATLLNHVGHCVSIDDRRFVTDENLRALLTALVNAKIVMKHVDAASTTDPRTWYSFDDHHPFFRITAERAIR